MTLNIGSKFIIKCLNTKILSLEISSADKNLNIKSVLEKNESCWLVKMDRRRQ